MNIYEKIIVGIIGFVVVSLSVFSYVELTEDSNTEFVERETSDFDDSFGDAFIMSTFTKVLNITQSDEREENCEIQKPVLVSILYNLNEELETSYANLFKGDDSFEVNQETLDIFCAKTGTVLLGDALGNTLLLEKIPFVSDVRSQQYEEKMGTQVEIKATITEKEGDIREVETFSRSMLIPYSLLE